MGYPGPCGQPRYGLPPIFGEGHAYGTGFISLLGMQLPTRHHPLQTASGLARYLRDLQGHPALHRTQEPTCPLLQKISDLLQLHPHFHTLPRGCAGPARAQANLAAGRGARGVGRNHQRSDRILSCMFSYRKKPLTTQFSKYVSQKRNFQNMFVKNAIFKIFSSNTPFSNIFVKHAIFKIFSSKCSIFSEKT